MTENNPRLARLLGAPSIDPAFRRQLEGYSLATARIWYRLPDALHVLNELIVQKYDRAPHFPEFRQYFDWWQRTLDGPIHSVEIAHAQLIRPAEFRMVGHEIRLQ